jgi:DNA-binding CsgD family transcriptional regulator
MSGSAEVRAEDLRAILGLLSEVHQASGTASFAGILMEGLGGVVDCDLVSYNEIDLIGGSTQTFFEPALVPRPQLEEAFAGLIHQHPLVERYAATRDPRPLRMSDFISLAELKSRDLYQEVFRPLETNYQLAFSLAIDADVVIGIGLNRQRRDFCDRDLAAMAQLQTHLGYAFSHAVLKDRVAAEQRRSAHLHSQMSMLTQRETEVLSLLATGLSNMEIARTLFISRRTVEVHVSRLLTKLSVGSRAAAMALFLPASSGLPQPPK